MSRRIFYTILALMVIGLTVVITIMWFRHKDRNIRAQSVSAEYAQVDISRYLSTSLVQEISRLDDFYSLLNQSIMPLVIKFHATWCGVCESMKPIDRKMAQLFTGKVAVVEVDVDSAIFAPVLEQFVLASVPTYLFIKNGEVVKRVSGAMGMNEYQTIVADLTTS